MARFVMLFYCFMAVLKLAQCQDPFKQVFTQKWKTLLEMSNSPLVYVSPDQLSLMPFGPVFEEEKPYRDNSIISLLEPKQESEPALSGVMGKGKRLFVARIGKRNLHLRARVGK
uniref:Uncharacterized protein n=1 Tax=Ditylenchus dipsaci TaxID=166011 RepID=A0A915DHK6_9BILA